MQRSMNFVLILLCAGLASCSVGPMVNQLSGQSNQGTPLGVGTVPGVAIGGSIARSMDSFDRVRMHRALDKSPGTSTSWRNANSGINYTVTPIQKVTINGNPYCRRYETVATKNGQSQRLTGTACVASDGGWSEVNG